MMAKFGVKLKSLKQVSDLSVNVMEWLENNSDGAG